MGGVMNGMAMHRGLLPVGGTFLTFSDYMRGAIRLAAISEAHVVYSFTHDSLGLGEDGPTHQPIEHLAALRAIPRLVTIRPADANEAAGAWRVAIGRTNGPTALILSRQGLPTLPGPLPVERGAYVLEDGDDCILIATGSEVQVALEARGVLGGQGISARVVSMPSFELFRAQERSYRDEVLPPAIGARVAVEAASPFGWAEWVGSGGAVVGIDRFGASAPGPDVMAAVGITSRAVADAAKAQVGR